MGPIMSNKIKSTYDEFFESLTLKEQKEFNEGYKDLALSELILALMARDEVSVRKLAKVAGVSPTVVQAMKSGSKDDFNIQSFFKILKGLGCNKILVEFNGKFIPMNITQYKN